MFSPKLSVPILAGLTALFLTACAAPSNPPTVVEKIVLVGVPASLLMDCTRVDLTALRTNGDMAVALSEQDASIVSCNLDKAAIRALMPEGNP